jgi:3-methyladenine DNA glycosylase AlkD
VSLVPLVRHGIALETAYSLVASRRRDQEDLMHKAMGWLLREAGKVDAERLARFLEREGAALPRTTVRYAIERFPPARRARLLATTRPTR